MLTGFACNVGKGINLDLSCLTEKQKKQLIKFIARVSEVSYRRGFQQGYASYEYQRCTIDPFKFRYERNIDQSPWAENGKNSGRTAIDILSIEYSASFDSIGLPLPIPEYA